MPIGSELEPLAVLRSYRPHDYTLRDAVESRLAAGPSRPFLLDRRGVIDWADAQRLAGRLAAALSERGVGPGDRVAVIARNDPMTAILFLATGRIGAIMAPLNPQYRSEEAAYVIGHADPKLLVCEASTLDFAREACHKAGLEPEFLLLDAEAGDGLRLADLLEASGASFENPAVTADDPCLIIYTSGTSGFPKGVLHTQRTVLLSGEIFLQRMGLQPDDRLMIVLPMFHINALLYSLSGTIAAGCSAYIQKQFSASTFWKTAAEAGVTEVNVIEAMGQILAQRPRSEYDPAHRIVKAYGVRQPAAAVFQAEFGVGLIVSGFGMTEAPGVLSPTLGSAPKAGNLGVLGRHPDPAIPAAQIRILDDDRNDVAPGETGELAVRTPVLMQGYFRDPEQTRASFHDGWFLTGDLVRQGEDGSYFFVSRKKDIIRKKGNNIAGAELDRIVGQHPDVKEVAAIGVPSELGEEEVLILVVPRPGTDIGAEELVAWCAVRLEPIKVPRYVLFTDALPYTPTHKVAKNVLKQDATLQARAFDMAKPGRAATSEIGR